MEYKDMYKPLLASDMREMSVSTCLKDRKMNGCQSTAEAKVNRVPVRWSHTEVMIMLERVNAFFSWPKNSRERREIVQETLNRLHKHRCLIKWTAPRVRYYFYKHQNDRFLTEMHERAIACEQTCTIM